MFKVQHIYIFIYIYRSIRPPPNSRALAPPTQSALVQVQSLPFLNYCTYSAQYYKSRLSNRMGSLVESDVECCNGSSSCKQEDIIIPANRETYLKAPFDVEEFREHAHKMVDFIADRYYHKIETFPVLSQVQPGYLRTLLPDSAPDHPETVEAVLADVKEKIIPGLTHWLSPNFFGLMPSNGSTASYLGEMLCTGFNVIGFNWLASPDFVELETIVLDWLAKALNLPHAFLSSSGKGGCVIQGTASEAVVVSMVATREKALKKLGANSLEKLVVYASDQTHSSIEKACKVRQLPLRSF
eukprot:Gb_10830 [translate_table: standard]